MSASLIGTAEACEILGVDRSTLTRWAADHTQPGQRKLTVAMRLPGRNGAVLYDRAEVLSLAETLEREAFAAAEARAYRRRAVSR